MMMIDDDGDGGGGGDGGVIIFHRVHSVMILVQTHSRVPFTLDQLHCPTANNLNCPATAYQSVLM